MVLCVLPAAARTVVWTHLAWIIAASMKIVVAATLFYPLVSAAAFLKAACTINALWFA